MLKLLTISHFVFPDTVSLIFAPIEVPARNNSYDSTNAFISITKNLYPIIASIANE